MRKLLTLLLILGASATNSAGSPTVLVLGDSLSAGYGIDVDQSWTALLQSRLQAEGYEHRVVNASISGETTEGGAARISSALAEFNPEVVVIALGGNDGLRGFPPERIKANLGRIVDAAAEKDAAVVLLGIRIPSNYGPRYTQAFESVYRELASERDLPWIEFFMEGVAQDENLMQDDGIHPNEKAQPVLLDNAWPVIQEALNADIRAEQNTN
jgi:acyl-CoA thioesterase-1